MVVTPSERTQLASRTYATDVYAGIEPYSARVELGRAQIEKVAARTFWLSSSPERQHIRVRYEDDLGYSASQMIYATDRVKRITDSLAFHLDASQNIWPQVPTLDCNPLVWNDLSNARLQAVLKGFENCNLSSGWNGSGAVGDPYRLVLDGRDDFLDVPVSFKAEAFSAEVWFRTRGAPDTRPLISKISHRDHEDGFAMTLDQNRLSFYVNEARQSQVQAPFSSLGEYTHAVATYDGYFLRLYVNGRLWAARPYQKPVIWKKGPVQLGGAPGFAFFGGSIVETALYSRALLSDEIRQNCLASQDRYFDSMMCW